MPSKGISRVGHDISIVDEMGADNAILALLVVFAAYFTPFVLTAWLDTVVFLWNTVMVRAIDRAGRSHRTPVR